MISPEKMTTLTVDQPYTYIQSILKKYGLPVYGTKTQLMCKTFGLKQPKTKPQLMDLLVKNDVQWQYDLSTKKITYWKNSVNRANMQYTSSNETSYDGNGIDCDVEEYNGNQLDTFDSLDNTLGNDLASANTANESNGIDCDVEEYNGNQFDTFDSLDNTLGFENCCSVDEDVAMTTADEQSFNNVTEGAGEPMVVTVMRDENGTKFICKQCNRSFTTRRNFIRHYETQHDPSTDNSLQCATCSKTFKCKDYFDKHARNNHITPTPEVDFVLRYNGNNVVPVKWRGTDEERGSIFQLVAIPWSDSENNIVQVSIGYTSLRNLRTYASAIWKNVRFALKNRSMKVVACSSAVVTAKFYEIRMLPSEAFTLNLFMDTICVTNFVKGYVRERISSIGHNAKPDIFGILSPSHRFIESQLGIAVNNGQLSQFNSEIFLYHTSHNNAYRRRKFDIDDFSEIGINAD